MFGFGKSENLKEFENVVEGMGEDEMRYVSMSVYNCWKMFNVKYESVQNWQKNEVNQVKWITFLEGFAKEQLKKEMAGDLPFGWTMGVWLSIFFFKAVALNEGAEAINTMSDHMEKFNRIGYQINQETNKT